MMDVTEAVQRKVLVLDGGMGTMLIARGLRQGQPGEAWNIEHSETVEEIHREYARAGADAITTNTFGGSPLKLAKIGLADRCEAVNAAAVRSARAAADPDRLVLGDVGPTGEMRQPMGRFTRDDFHAAFVEQVSHLEAAGVDAFVIETMYDLQEALAALDACTQVSRRPVIACMTFNRSPRGFFTMMGDAAADAMRVLVDAGAWAVGSNCSLGSDAMVDLAREIRHAVACPVLIQPNAGAPQVVDAEIRYPEGAEFFADNMRKVTDLGVQMVGGCCGTTPEYTAAIARAVRG